MQLVRLSSTLPLLLLLLLVSVHPSTGYSPSEDGREATQHSGGLTPEPLTYRSGYTKGAKTDEATTTTTDGETTTTDGDTTTTTDGETTTTTDGDTTTTTDGETTTTTDGATTGGATETDSTTTPPIDGLDLYKETRSELELISDVLNKFTNLVNPEAEAAPASASEGRVQGGRGHPAAWWLRGEAAFPRDSSYNFCVEANNDLCLEVEIQLEETDNILYDLIVNVDAWQYSDLIKLQLAREDLNETYEQAEEHKDTFKESVEEEIFRDSIDDVKQHVRTAQNTVQEKIDQLDPPSNSGSVAVVAVVGSVGGLMILAIIGAMVYATVKRPKGKKLPSASSGKVKDENIPIDTFVQDGPLSHPASKMDHHSQAPGPALSSHPYSGPFGPRREPGHPESMDGRHQRGLRRTNF